MDTFLDQLFNFVDFSISPLGLIIQSLVLILITLTTLSLLHAARSQIAKRDLQGARSSLYWVLGLQVVMIILYLSSSLGWWQISARMLPASQNMVWTLNLILVGWLWFKPSQRSQFSIFKMVLSLSAFVLFLLQAFQVIEFVFSPLEISVPYDLIWRVLEFLIGFFLFFSYISHTDHFIWSSILFVSLHIIGLGIHAILTIPPLFAKELSQVIAFLFTPQLFLALSFDSQILEKRQQNIPLLLSENVAVIPPTQLINDWLHTALENNSHILPPYTLCKALARTFFADACFIIEADSAGHNIKLLCGFILKPHKQILPRVIQSEHEIIIQQRSVLYHNADSYPLWIKDLLNRMHFPRAQSIWYIPLPINQHPTLLFLVSRKLLWNQEHIEMSKHILPYLVQILQNYFQDDRIVSKKEDQSTVSTNPFLDLMKSEIDYRNDPQHIEEELKLALEEYNRIRKILEERGIGQSL
ncbi:MAG: hypothetical protein GYA52_00845 [Chloroflexi bacterium]|nr:hypothetical protein [Chloroflexota bacterium]